MATLGEKSTGQGLMIPAAGGPPTQGAQAPNISGGGGPGVQAVEAAPYRRSMGGSALGGQGMQMAESAIDRRWREKMHSLERSEQLSDREHAEDELTKRTGDERKYEREVFYRNQDAAKEQAKFQASQLRDAQVATEITNSINTWKEAHKTYGDQNLSMVMQLAGDPNIDTSTLVKMVGDTFKGYYPSAHQELDALKRISLSLGLDPESSISGPLVSRYEQALSQKISSQQMSPPPTTTTGQFGPEAPEDALWEDFKASGTIPLEATIRANAIRLAVLSKSTAAKTEQEKQQVHDAFLEGISNLELKKEQFFKSVGPMTKIVSGLDITVTNSIKDGDIPLDTRARAIASEAIATVVNGAYTGTQVSKDTNFAAILTNYLQPLDDRVGGEPIKDQLLKHLNDPQNNPLDPGVKAAAGYTLLHLARAISTEFPTEQGKKGRWFSPGDKAVWEQLAPDQQQATRTRINELAASFEAAGQQLTLDFSTNIKTAELINEMLARGNDDMALGSLGVGQKPSRVLVQGRFADMAKAFTFKGDQFLNPKTASSLPARIQQEIGKFKPSRAYSKPPMEPLPINAGISPYDENQLTPMDPDEPPPTNTVSQENKPSLGAQSLGLSRDERRALESQAGKQAEIDNALESQETRTRERTKQEGIKANKEKKKKEERK